MYVCLPQSFILLSKDNLRQAAMADITRVLIRSLRNGDTVINLKDLKLLTLRLTLTLQEHGVRSIPSIALFVLSMLTQSFSSSFAQRSI